MSTRRQRKSLSDAARSDSTASSASAAAGPTTAEAAVTAITAEGAKKRKKASDSGIKQESTTSEPSSTTPTSSTKNRRVAKKAKLDSAAIAAEEARKKAEHAASLSKSTKYRARVKEQMKQVKDEEEKELEAFLFGGVETQPLVDEDEDDEEMPQAAAAPAAKPSKSKSAGSSEADLFQIDTTGGLETKIEKDADAEEEEAEKQKSKKSAKAAEAPKPAWIDDDDTSPSQLVDLSSAARLRKLKTGTEERFITGAEYSRRLRQIYRELHPNTEEWAALPTDATDADITKLLLQSTSTLTTVASGGAVGVNGKLPGGAGRGEKLPSTSIELVRMKDANLTSPNQSIVSVCKFHEAGQLLFTGGLDKMIRLFQIDGIENTKVQGIWLEDCPIMSAEWLKGSTVGQSTEIIASGRRSYFYSIDIQTNSVTKVPNLKGREEKSLEKMAVSPNGEWIAFLGNDGYILLCSGKSKQFIGSMKQNVSVRSISFSADSSCIYSIGGEGIMYIWDIATRKCLYKFQDEGNISGTAIAQGANGYFALGSESGVVNMYNDQQISAKISAITSSTSASSSRLLSTLTQSPPAPLKSFMNLTTPIDSLLFNSDAQLLLMSSRRKKDALKLIHVESQTVFQNWPTSSTPLHFVSAMDFSPNSGYMALGNDKGRVLLYRLTHYPRA